MLLLPLDFDIPEKFSGEPPVRLQRHRLMELGLALHRRQALKNNVLYSGKSDKLLTFRPTPVYITQFKTRSHAKHALVH